MHGDSDCLYRLQQNLEGTTAINTKTVKKDKDWLEGEHSDVSHYSVSAVTATVVKVARNYIQVKGRGCVPIKLYL